MAKTRAFVRYLKGKLVPGSLIFTSGEYPKAPFSSGKWKELTFDLCCQVGEGAKIKASSVQSSYPIQYPAFVIYTINNPTSGNYQYIFSTRNETVNSLAEHVALLNQQFGNIGYFYIDGSDVYVNISQSTADIFSTQILNELRFEIFND